MENIEKIEINGHYVWVDKDAEIKTGDYALTRNNEVYKVWIEKETDDSDNKIIASSPEFNLKGIPSYVEWLAEQNYEATKYNPFETTIVTFIKGYQSAEKELFTEDDIRKAIDLARYYDDGWSYSEEEIIEQLKQPKL